MANLLNVLAFLLLWRAGQQLLGHPVMAREQAGLAALSGVLIVVFGLSPETAQQRVAIVPFAIAWISCRASTLAYDRLRREQIPGAAIALILTGWIVGLLLIARGVSGLVSDTPIEFSHDAPVTLALAYVLLVAIFAVNLVFAYVLLQRTVRALTRLSRVDPLTGLFNRRAIVEALQREWQRHGPDGAGFSVDSRSSASTWITSRRSTTVTVTRSATQCWSALRSACPPACRPGRPSGAAAAKSFCCCCRAPARRRHAPGPRACAPGWPTAGRWIPAGSVMSR